jgi:hypothetical protein
MAKSLMYDFKCPFCQDQGEYMVQPQIKFLECGCGEHKERMISSPTIKLEGLTGDFPTAADRWANVHEQAARVSRKRNEGKYDADNTPTVIADSSGNIRL